MSGWQEFRLWVTAGFALTAAFVATEAWGAARVRGWLESALLMFVVCILLRFLVSMWRKP